MKVLLLLILQASSMRVVPLAEFPDMNSCVTTVLQTEIDEEVLTRLMCAPVNSI